MALIPYAYDPTTQDLFLYEDHTISWTLPTPGSLAVKRPYAWNPNSPLYGYRKSLHGISAPYRTFSMQASPAFISDYSVWNDPALEVNKPAFYNSFPPHSACVSPRFMLSCRHCIGVTSDRNPSSRVVPSIYQADSYLASTLLFRFIRHDNQILDISPTDVIGLYVKDTSIPFPAAGQGPGLSGDAAIGEFLSDQAIEPIMLTDAKYCGKGSTAWFVDGSMKIIRMAWENSYTRGRLGNYQMSWRKPDGSDVPYPVAIYFHDSGSRIFVEVKPPTSASAGDGVLASLPNHLVNAADYHASPKNDNYMEFYEAPGVLANFADFQLDNSIDIYLSARGYSMTTGKARRKTAPSLQSVDEQIFILVGTNYGSFTSPTTADGNYGMFSSLTSLPSNYGAFGAT